VKSTSNPAPRSYRGPDLGQMVLVLAVVVLIAGALAAVVNLLS
jgi:hypothetical protein